jgi:hypothetical protein
MSQCSLRAPSVLGGPSCWPPAVDVHRRPPSGSRCCRTVFQCGRAGNSIAIVGMARRHGVAPEGAHTAPGRTLPHLHDPGPVVLVAEAAREDGGARTCAGTCTGPDSVAHLHAAGARPRTAPGLGSSVHADRGPGRHRADTELSAASPKAMRDPVAFCRKRMAR